MRILQINNHQELRGGSERVFQATSSMLVNKGHDVATLACGRNPFDPKVKTFLMAQKEYNSRKPFKLAENSINFLYRDETYRQILEINRQFKPDIAHLHIFYGQLSSAVIAALKEVRIPCVMTVHEYRMLCPISTMYSRDANICEKCASGRYINTVLGRCNRGSIMASALSATEAWFRDKYFRYDINIDHFFMVSEFCLRKHVQYMPTIAEKSSVLYNFIDNDNVADSVPELDNAAPFLYSGRMSYEKGLKLLCEAFRRLPHLNLQIAGEGPISTELRNAYAGTGNIHFLGKLNYSELQRTIRNSRYTVIPSEWYENNPMSALESFSQGTPVIGSAIGGIPELVKPGQTGELFEPGNLDNLMSVLQLAADLPEDKRRAMGRNALSMIKANHTSDVYYDRLLTGYKNVISNYL